MRYILVATWAAVVGFGAAGAGPEDPLNAKMQLWQKVLERMTFRFHDSDANMLFALSQYRADCKVHMVYDPKKRTRVTFNFVRDGKNILSTDGHVQSVFRTANNVLYFAHFWPSTPGCTVIAHDLTTGKKLWETKLSAAGTTSDSDYENQVTLGLGSVFGDKEGEGIVSIRARESFGDYIEILDQKTGTLLAHKIYRHGFEKSK